MRHLDLAQPLVGALDPQAVDGAADGGDDAGDGCAHDRAGDAEGGAQPGGGDGGQGAGADLHAVDVERVALLPAGAGAWRVAARRRDVGARLVHPYCLAVARPRHTWRVSPPNRAARGSAGGRLGRGPAGAGSSAAGRARCASRAARAASATETTARTRWTTLNAASWSCSRIAGIRTAHTPTVHAASRSAARVAARRLVPDRTIVTRAATASTVKLRASAVLPTLSPVLSDPSPQMLRMRVVHTSRLHAASDVVAGRLLMRSRTLTGTDGSATGPAGFSPTAPPCRWWRASSTRRSRAPRTPRRSGRPAR